MLALPLAEVEDIWATRWLMALLTMLLCAIGYWMTFILKGGAARNNRVLTLAFISLVATALGVLLGAMPGVQRAVADLSGPWGALVINLSGPPAIWAILFFVLCKFSPGEDVADATWSGLIAQREAASGFDDYKTWVAHLDACRPLVKKDEMHFIADILPNVFYSGNDETRRPSKAQVDTVFVFRKDVAVKFQVIECSVEKPVNEIDVFCPGTASTVHGDIRSCFFEDSDLGLVPHMLGGPTWKSFQSKAVRGMLVAVYKNDVAGPGDYIYCDATKFINRARGQACQVSLTIVSDKKVATASCYDVAASLDTGRTPVALIFRRKSRDHEVRKDEIAPRLEVLLSGFLRKLAPLQASADEPDASVGRFLDEVLAATGTSTIDRFWADEAYQGFWLHDEREQVNVLLTMWMWQAGL